jgi:hypothetical protein
MEQGVEGETIMTDKIEVRLPGETTAQYLLRLEQSNKYLFHGSKDPLIDKLKPRPANDADLDPWKNDTAVYAHGHASVAIQSAIRPSKTEINGECRIITGTRREPPYEPLIQMTENVHLSPGVVYVLPKEGFERHLAEGQWKSKVEVAPLAIIGVNMQDYQEIGGQIEIIR